MTEMLLARRGNCLGFWVLVFSPRGTAHPLSYDWYWAFRRSRQHSATNNPANRMDA